MKGMNLITYLDDASRCVTGAALFKEAASENAVTVLRQAISRFGVPATILSDNGSCFVGVRGRKKPEFLDTNIVRERAAVPQHRPDQLKTIPSADQRKTRTIPQEHQRRDMALWLS